MAVQAPATSRAPRLNPFAFPSDTDFRFILLVVSVLGSSMIIYNWLFYSFPNSAIVISTATRCQQMLQEVKATFATAPAYKYYEALSNANKICQTGMNRAIATWIVAGVGILLGLAFFVDLTFPSLKMRRERLVVLSPHDAPDVVTYLADLCREAEIPRCPTFLWNPLNPAISGLAFGRFGRHYIVISGGLITQFYTDRFAFRAVILHELAHLRNADVDKTYFSVAVWKAFILAALVPFVISLRNYDWGSLVNVGWHMVALAALVYVTRNAVLRAREFYADVRASQWDGPGGALGRVLEALPRRTKYPLGPILQVHPDPADRRRMLDEPNRLLRMGFWDAFGTGLAATIAFPNVASLMTAVLGGIRASTTLAPLAAALIFAPLAVGIVGSGAWRQAFAAVGKGESSPDAGRLGFGLGLGALTGGLLSFQTFGVPSFLASLPEKIRLTFGSSFNVFWSALLVISLVFFFRWVAVGASIWLGVAVKSRSPRPIYLTGLIIASGILASWLGLLFSVQEFQQFAPTIGSALGENGFVPLALTSLQYILLQPLTLPVLASVWAFPLASWFWRAPIDSTPASRWVFLDNLPHSIELPRRESLHPVLALRIGLIAGVVFSCLLMLIRLAVRIGFSATNMTSEQLLMYFYGQVALAAVLQATAAVIAIVRVKRLGWLHGFFSAFVAGCVMAGAILGLNLLFGGKIDLAFAWFTIKAVVNGGAVLAILAALVVSRERPET